MLCVIAGSDLIQGLKVDPDLVHEDVTSKGTCMSVLLLASQWAWS